MHGDAVLSADGRYRYHLTRVWGSGPGVVFVLLNPSTADDRNDDSTIRRCLTFARDWGCTSLAVINLYALRTRSPAALLRDPSRVDAHNDDHLREVVAAAAGNGDLLVGGWGARAEWDRVARVVAIPGMARLTALGTTKAGHPRHPLMLRRGLVPRRWDPAPIPA